MQHRRGPPSIELNRAKGQDRRIQERVSAKTRLSRTSCRDVPYRFKYWDILEGRIITVQKKEYRGRTLNTRTISLIKQSVQRESSHAKDDLMSKRFCAAQY